MLSRTLSLATVTLLIGCFSVGSAQAQATNLEAGKGASQIFAGTCTACHKSPRGLLKSVAAGSLQGFLRQHYTTSPEMATLLSGFLVSNGATDTRYIGYQSKDAKPDAKPGGPVEQLDRFGHKLRPGGTQEAARPPEPEPKPDAKPDADGHQPQAEPEAGRNGRNAKRLARPGEAPETAKPAAEGQAPPAQAAIEAGPDGRKSAAKQRLSKRGRPGGEEPPKIDAAKPDAAKEAPASDEAVKDDTAKSETDKSDKGDKSETAKIESGKTEGRPESAKVDSPRATGGGETPAMRPDPVPPVTPAPPASPAVSAAITGGASQPAAAPSAPPAPSPPPPAMTASVPPAPAAPAGPPLPPISQ